MRQYSIAFLACVALGLPGFGTTALAQGTAPAPAPVRVNAGLPSAGGQNIAAGASSEQPAPQPMFAMRGGRPVITLADGNFTMQPVLRLDADAGGFWDQPFYPGNRPRQLGSEGPGVPDPLMNVRRARLGVQGTFLKDFTYNFTWEFAPGPGRQFDPGVNSRIFELQAAYTGFKNTVIRVGGFTLNYTLEFATSSFETLMMERPAIVNIAASLAAGDTRLAQGIETRGENWFLSAYFSQNVLSAASSPARSTCPSTPTASSWRSASTPRRSSIRASAPARTSGCATIPKSGWSRPGCSIPAPCGTSTTPMRLAARSRAWSAR